MFRYRTYLFQVMPTRKAIERPRQTQQERLAVDRVRLRYLPAVFEKQREEINPSSVLAVGLDRRRRSKEIEIYPKKAEEELARVKGCGDNPCCFRSLYFVPQTATNHLCGDYSSRSGTFFDGSFCATQGEISRVSFLQKKTVLSICYSNNRILMHSNNIVSEYVAPN